ncbi:hypothetical protein CI610_00046 [invertebrate metagenome]|uniref:CopG protein n=1 Tax=invertebrate metagenome TaxID=1711999 RepID=A0A2H9TCS5_9ZZZZ
MIKVYPLICGLTIALIAENSAATSINTSITVYKSPYCGCCSAWIKHLERHGFSVITHDTENLQVYKQQANLPYGLGSCHTAFVDQYAIEGHVPAQDIQKMLSEKPDFRGLAVPGMPAGSPGMDFSDKKERYQTLGYTIQGQTDVYKIHGIN